MAQNYCIVLDTNILYIPDKPEEESAEYSSDLSVIFSHWLSKLVNFRDQYGLENLEICIPRIVIEERVEQRAKQIIENLTHFNNRAKKLKGVDSRISEISLSEEDVKKLLREKALEIINNFKIRIIESPNLEKYNILERVISYTPPFKKVSRNKDAGLKDVIIFLSLLEDSTKNLEKNYILFTNNSIDFTEKTLLPQFAKVSNSKFKVLNELQGIKEYLNSELKLNMNKSETTERFIKIVKEKWEEIKKLLLSKELRYNEHASSSTLMVQGNKIVDYVLNEIIISDITPSIEKRYELIFDLKLTPIYQSNIWIFGGDSIGQIEKYSGKLSTINFEAEYFEDAKKLKINNLTFSNPLVESPKFWPSLIKEGQLFNNKLKV